MVVIIRHGDLSSIYSKQSCGGVAKAKAAKKMRRNYEFRVGAKAANILMFLSRFGPAAAAHVFNNNKTAQAVCAKNISEHKLNSVVEPSFV